MAPPINLHHYLIEFRPHHLLSDPIYRVQSALQCSVSVGDYLTLDSWAVTAEQRKSGFGQIVAISHDICLSPDGVNHHRTSVAFKYVERDAIGPGTHRPGYDANAAPFPAD